MMVVKPSGESALPRARLAPIGYRAVARGLDTVAFAFVIAFVYVEIVHRVSGTTATNLVDASREAGVSLRLTVVVASIVYELVPMALVGRTFGKLVLGLAVERVNGGSPGFVRAFVRWLVPTTLVTVPVIGLFLYAGVLGVALIDRRRQGLHDKVAGTIVVDRGIGRFVRA